MIKLTRFWRWLTFNVSFVWYYFLYSIGSAMRGAGEVLGSVGTKHMEDIREEIPDEDPEKFRRDLVIKEAIAFLKITGIPEDRYQNRVYGKQMIITEDTANLYLDTQLEINKKEGHTIHDDDFSWTRTPDTEDTHKPISGGPEDPT